jgi:PAS domain S-box-containing protein
MDRLVYANYAAARLIGYPSVEALLRTPSGEVLSRYELFDEFGAPFPLNSLPGRLALTGMRVPEAVIRFRNKTTGEERWSHVKARPIFDGRGEITLAINLFQDITTFKTSERRIQEERNRFEVTLASIGDAVIATDVNGRVTFLNPTAETLTGWKRERASGKDIKTVFVIVNEETRQPAENPVDRVLREGGGIRLANHTTLVAQDGTEYPIEDSGAPIRDLDGNTIGVVLVFRDITDRRQAEQERAELLRREQAARAAAEEANQLKLQFLALISHELRTPLASIKGFATTLLAPDVQWDKSSQEEYIEIINQESDRLTELVEQLLDISRLQAGALRTDQKPQSLGAMVEAAKTRLHTITRDHRLVLNIPADLPPVLADEQRVAQVLVNLVDNAAKYSPPQTRIEVAAHQVDGAVQVDVSDEGEGIPTQDRGAVFEAFRQIHHRLAQKGAGLGLAISKGLVEAHGGRIWIQDGAAPGTTVSFTLPIAPGE